VAATLRLAMFAAAVALVTTRLGLIAHELVGHGGAASAVGAGVDDLRLFWFAGGWIQYSRPGGLALTEVLVIQLGGIAIELCLGAAAMVWARCRTGWLGLAVTGAGAGWVIHAAAYLAIGTWHGYGDGVILHRALGDAVAAVAVPAAVVAAVAAFVAARALLGRLEAAVPLASRAARLASIAVAIALAGGINAGLARAELVVRGDTTYGAIMRPERDRTIDRELAAWLAAQRARGGDADAVAVAARRRALEASRRAFPFWIVVVGGIAVAGVAGAARNRGPAGAPGLERTTVAAAVAAAAVALVLVVIAGAAFPL
jgi:hypothetical protein